MKLLPVTLLAASLVLGHLATAAAQSDTVIRVRTAGDLADLCGAKRTDPAGPERINFCHGYTEASFEMELRREKSLNQNRICLPTPAPARTSTLNEFVGWVRSMPEHASRPALNGFFEFMSQRYPCSK